MYNIRSNELATPRSNSVMGKHSQLPDDKIACVSCLRKLIMATLKRYIVINATSLTEQEKYTHRLPIMSLNQYG